MNYYLLDTLTHFKKKRTHDVDSVGGAGVCSVGSVCLLG